MKNSMMKHSIKNALYILLALVTALAFAVIALPEAYAYDPIATVSVDSQTEHSYSSLDTLCSDMSYWDGRSVTITMTKDWNNEAENGSFGRRLVIPKNSKVTFNMNGYVFDRYLSAGDNWEKNGELICMESGSSLTINGGKSEEAKGRRHDEGVHFSVNADDYATEMKSFYGGVLTGGSSTNGAGGIHVKSDCTLIMNDVTLAGCRAEVPWYDSAGTSSGYGGGIWVEGGNSTVKLNNTTITGNHAQKCGGGIFGSNHNKIRIEMDNSHVDANYSRGSGGGGIDLDGEDLACKGKNGSTVSNNETSGRGGGVYLWNDSVELSGLKIENNKADLGGGVYTLEESISLINLDICGNTANNGGGIYVANDSTTITGCSVTGNTSNGVYVEDDVDSGFTLGGKTIIKDNGSGGRKNLVLQDSSTQAAFSLITGSDIGIGYAENPSGNFCYISGKSADYRYYLTPDDSNYYISYSYADSGNGRRLAYVRNGSSIDGGETITIPETEKLSPSQAAPSVVGKVKAGGDKSGSGDDYALIRAFAHHQKADSYSIEGDTENLFYYSDAFFYSDPYEYNEHLATASINLVNAGMYLMEGGTKQESYKYKHAAARQFLSDIGCDDQYIYVNDNNVKKPGSDTMGVTIGSKPLTKYGEDGMLEPTGDILITVAPRGGGYEAEWSSNFEMGSGQDRDGEHQGFSEAADQIMSALDYYIGKYSLEDELAAGKVKFWVAGFSRGGATANITAKRLVEKYACGEEGRNNQVFAYPCEAAQGGTDSAETLSDKTKYYCIHNVVNAGDVVPLAGPSQMGFKRYGVDHYVPGTEVQDDIIVSTADATLSGEEGVQVTTYADNTRINSKKGDPAGDEGYEDYKTRRSRMLKHLAAIDPSITYDDYFQTKGLDIAGLNFGGDAGDYEGSLREDFLIDFMAFMQSSTSLDRKTWATKVLSLNGNTYVTPEKAVKESMALYFTMDGETSTNIMERLALIYDAMSGLNFSSNVSMRDIYDDVIGDWHLLTEEEKLKYINYFWGLIRDCGALDFLPEGEAAKLEQNWPVLADMMFRFTDADWAAKPGKEYTYPSGNEHAWAKNTDDYMMYSLTLMSHMWSTFLNHFPEIDQAWMRTYDSYYDDGNGPLAETFKTYDVSWGSGSSIDAPEAFVMSGGAEEPKLVLESGESKENVLAGDQKIYLDNPDSAGEAVYYTLTETSGGSVTELEEDQIYRGGIDLSTTDPETYESAERTFRITSYARHYGVNSGEAVYNVKLTDDKHAVTVSLGPEGTYMNNYHEGDTVRITAPDSSIGLFRSWKIIDDNDKNITDLLLKDGAANNASAEFVMPKAGTTEDGYTWTDDYVLHITALYDNKTKIITVNEMDVPGSGNDLDESAAISFDNCDEEVTLPVFWTYKAGEDTSTHTGAVYNNTEYTAIINVPQDPETGRVFASEQLTGIAEGAKEVSVIRNDADGSATIYITYEATAPEGGDEPPELCRTLTVRAYDVSAGKYISEIDDSFKDTSFRVSLTGQINLIAPDVRDEYFTGWVLNGFALPPDGDMNPKEKFITVFIPAIMKDFSVEAQYAPVINRIDAQIDAPSPGRALPESASITVTVTNTYEISPENISVSWSPSDDIAKSLTAYTATLKLVPDSEGKIHVRPAGSEGAYDIPQDAGSIVTSGSIDVRLNGEKVDYSSKDMTMSYKFKPVKYDLKSVKPVENIEDLPHGSGASDIKAALPKSTKAVSSDGTEMDAAINWGTPEKISGGDLDSSEWAVRGKVVLPEDRFNPAPEEMLRVSVKVNVKEADPASAPRASVESGTYLGNQVITLSTSTSGGDIYYTTDGSSPTAESTKYDGEEIFFSRAGYADGLTIRAITVKSGMRDSSEAYYEYRFTDEVEVPAGRTVPYTGHEQTGISAGAFYTLEAASEGVTIDAEGNAVAAEAGTYEVKAKIAEGMKWKIKAEDGSESTSTEDQIITFSIVKPGFGDIFEILAKDSYDSIEQLKADIKVVSKDSGEELSEDSYEISYSKVSDGRVTVTVTGRGGFEGSITKIIVITNVNQMGIDGTPYGQGASEAAVNKAITGRSDHADPEGTVYNALRARSTKQSKKYIKIKWNAVSGASRYLVYGANCSSAYPYEKLGEVSGRSFKASGLKKGTYHKFIVVALDGDGYVISTSKVVHAATKGGKAGNLKKVTVNKKTVRKAKKLKAGGSLKLKAKQVKQGKKVKKHRALRYETTNPAVATVSAKGRITATGTGTCYIYAYAQNGVYKKIKVKVR